MPVESEITEKYYTWCKGKWGFRYPCRKTRTVIRWCYQFSIWKVNKFLTFTQNSACENNKEYTWKNKLDWSEFGFGTVTYTNVTKCFSKLKEGKDGCTVSDEGLGFERIDQ